MHLFVMKFNNINSGCILGVGDRTGGRIDEVHTGNCIRKCFVHADGYEADGVDKGGVCKINFLKVKLELY